jgi:biopolymer transport protein ExbB
MSTTDPAVGGIAFLLKGGFMMYPLLLSGLIALTVAIERFYVMQFRMTTKPGMVAEIIGRLRTSGDIKAALASVANSARPVASVIEVGLRDEKAPLEEIELSMQTQAEMWVPLLEKRLDILDTVITAAPLMGLLGTITGMMSSFQVLSEKGVNEPHAITGGVAEALIATATGLVIALLCLFAYNFFNHQVKMIIFEMENAGAQLLETRKILMRKAT